MTIKSDLESEITSIFREQWQVAKGYVVPEPASLKLSNDARHFERSTVLYADLSGSTSLVNNFQCVRGGDIQELSYRLCQDYSPI
jgi:hypothetical protein